jgi:hypothetical protein
MPQLGGVFNLFSDLDMISATELTLPGLQIDHHVLENHLANRILYPQTHAQTKQELDLDFSILHWALIKHPEVLFNQSQNRVVLPAIAQEYFPPLTRLIATVLLALPLDKVTDIWLKGYNNQQLLGSVIPRTMLQKLNITGELIVTIQNQQKTMIPGQLNLIPVEDKQVKITLNQQLAFNAIGGSLGVFIDFRGSQV